MRLAGSVHRLRGDFSPPVGQTLVLFSKCRMAVGEPLTFIGPDAIVLEPSQVISETRLTG
jgi:hypothetical protein